MSGTQNDQDIRDVGEHPGLRPRVLDAGMRTAPAFLSATTRGVRPSTVVMDLNEVETVEYIASGNKCIVTMKSGRYVTISDERSLPTFETIRDLIGVQMIIVPIPDEKQPNGNGRNVGTAREAALAASNNEQPSVRRDLMPEPPGLAANRRLGETAKDSRTGARQ